MRILFIDDYCSDFESGLKAKFGNDNVICQKTPNFGEIRKIIGKPDAPAVDIVLLDVMFDRDEDGNSCSAKDKGGELLKMIKDKYNIPVIILTTTARETNTEYPGADGVKSKPTNASDDKFYKMIFEESSKLVDVYNANLDKRLGMVVGDNPKMKEIAKSVIRLAKSPVSKVILVTGETGTGKEEICKAIHKEAGYSLNNTSYQVVHCSHNEPRDFRIKLGGFPRHQGAQASIGVLEILENLRWNGTLVIDEVDDLNSESQNILNRILEGQPFQQENNPNRVFTPGPGCRFIITAQRDLQQMFLEGKFRSDLWGRINANRIHLLPLRERKEIIPSLFKHIVRELTKEGHFDAYLRDDVKEKLLNYDYPQNIRELRNILTDAISRTSNSPLRPEDIMLPSETPHTDFVAPEVAAEKVFKKEWTYQNVLKIYRRDSNEMRKMVETLINKITDSGGEISQEILADYLQTNVNNVKQLLAEKKDKKTGNIILKKISLVEKKKANKKTIQH